MTPAWFSRVGSPLSPQERARVDAMFGADALLADAALDVIDDWRRGLEFVRAADVDSSWWNHEEEERERLWEQALQRHTEAELAERLAAAGRAAIDDIRGAARAAAARLGLVDDAAIEAAVGAAIMALHQCTLAELADEGDTHCFVHKHALFAGGRWPLGIHRGRYGVF